MMKEHENETRKSYTTIPHRALDLAYITECFSLDIRRTVIYSLRYFTAVVGMLWTARLLFGADAVGFDVTFLTVFVFLYSVTSLPEEGLHVMLGDSTTCRAILTGTFADAVILMIHVIPALVSVVAFDDHRRAAVKTLMSVALLMTYTLLAEPITLYWPTAGGKDMRARAPAALENLTIAFLALACRVQLGLTSSYRRMN